MEFGDQHPQFQGSRPCRDLPQGGRSSRGGWVGRCVDRRSHRAGQEHHFSPSLQRKGRDRWPPAVERGGDRGHGRRRTGVRTVDAARLPLGAYPADPPGPGDIGGPPPAPGGGGQDALHPRRAVRRAVDPRRGSGVDPRGVCGGGRLLGGPGSGHRRVPGCHDPAVAGGSSGIRGAVLQPPSRHLLLPENPCRGAFPSGWGETACRLAGGPPG